MTNWTIEDADKLYNISRWGNGYFSVNDKGNLNVLAHKDPEGPHIDVSEVVEEIKRLGIQFPVVIRFHDILRAQVTLLNKTFAKVIEEANFGGRYYGVFPIKVNQMREVVEEIMDAGAPFQHGLEAGSKTEVLTCLALNTNLQSLTVLNGYKDEDFLKLALLGTKIGRKVIIVVEKFSEFADIVKYSREMEIEPMIGVRTKLATKGAGRWEKSSGDNAKFGLTIAEILQGIEYLKAEKMLHTVKMIHFHIGSQIPDSRAIKDAVTEGARIYAKLKKMNVPLEYFDVGGGLGIDYDGSKSACVSSMNYNMKEYVEDVVYILKQICDLEDVDHPHIVSETGRAIAAPHSCVIMNVFGSTRSIQGQEFPVIKSPGEHILVQNMREIFDDLSELNYQGSYNDARQRKEEMVSAFKLGIINLETLYCKIISKIGVITKAMDYAPEEIQSLDQELANQYLCNFSVFQSAMDSWAIGQLLPVIPIRRLNEKPTLNCTLADITCDSDGKIDKFIDFDETKKTLPLHEIHPDEPYYVGLFLTGAYQDIMGDNHNLFGSLNEVHVYSDEEDPCKFYIEEVIRGHTSKDVLLPLQYSPESLIFTMKKLLDKQVQRKKIKPREGVKLIDFYEKCMDEYTYLKK
jgi:arginine decarboxylase